MLEVSYGRTCLKTMGLLLKFISFIPGEEMNEE
jgi:hypothetical protein